MMPIVVTCECGKQLRARDELAGKRGKCPACGRILVLSASQPPTAAPIRRAAAPAPLSPPPAPAADDLPLKDEDAFAAAPLATAASLAAPTATATLPEPPAPAPVAKPRRFMAGHTPAAEYLYWALLIAIVPLIISFLHSADDVSDRFEKTLTQAPTEIQEAIHELKEKFEIDGPMPSAVIPHLPSDFFAALPNDQLQGSLLARETWIHWGFAALSAGAFFALIVYMFPLGAVTRSRMLLVGLFTGTMGILLLLGFQFVAAHTRGYFIRGGGIAMILFYVVKLIGWAYEAAGDPENGFWLSFLAFSVSVGLCEELCKIIPLVIHFNAESGPSWRGACMWALASGAGFGVAEGIMYSGRYYNGIDGGEIYLVRFVSCVALHATWAAAAGISLFRKRSKLVDGNEHWLMTLGNIVAVIIVPIILHGLYDTLLKKDLNLLAAGAAVASFAWLAFQVESMRGRENATPVPVAA